MVSARTYPLWQALAVSGSLPEAALPTVIEALCAPAREPYGYDNRSEDWRKSALEKALPPLLARSSDAKLRARLIAARPATSRSRASWRKAP